MLSLFSKICNESMARCDLIWSGLVWCVSDRSEHVLHGCAGSFLHPGADFVWVPALAAGEFAAFSLSSSRRSSDWSSLICVLLMCPATMSCGVLCCAVLCCVVPHCPSVRWCCGAPTTLVTCCPQTPAGILRQTCSTLSVLSCCWWSG